MGKRSPLRNHLISAWKKTIDGPYTDLLINSERGMQLYFCMQLIEEFKNDIKGKKKFLIEPRVTLSSANARYPDVVICNRDQVIGVVELKYAPRNRPLPGTINKDLGTLVYFGGKNLQEDVTITNDRFCGKASVKKYTIASDAVLCWAGVYKGGLLPLSHEMVESMHERFLRLDALTGKDKDAEAYCDGEPILCSTQIW
jgi:hypothetical protein